MKFHISAGETVLLLAFGICLRTASPVPEEGSQSRLENVPRRRRQTSRQIDADQDGVESRGSFSVAFPPPKYENVQHSERGWRYIHGPPFQPHNSFNPKQSISLRHGSQLPGHNYQVAPYSNERPNFYVNSPPRVAPNPAVHLNRNPVFNPHLRDRTRNDNSEVLPHGYNNNNNRPQVSTINNVPLFREPSFSVLNHNPETQERHFRQDPRIQSHDSKVFHRQESQGGHGSFSGISKAFDGRTDQLPETPFSQSNNDDPQHHDRPLSDASRSDSSTVVVEDKIPEQVGNFRNDDKPYLNGKPNKYAPKPTNLAALLASTSSINFSNLESDKKSNADASGTEADDRLAKTENSKTRTSVPEHIRPIVSDPDQYYDELYDEFVDMYYDDEVNPNKEDKLIGETDESKINNPKLNNERINLTPLSSTPAEEGKEVTEAPTESSRSVKARERTHERTSVSTTEITATKPSSKQSTKRDLESSTTPEPRSNPISLSEILQELGLNLPQFLATLQQHGTSLKEFTEKLQTKSLSKREFKRAKGNVKKLLEILDGVSGNPGRKDVTTLPRSISTTESSESTVTLQVTETTPSLFSKMLSVTVASTESTTKLPKTTQRIKPKIFGSRPSGVPFSKTSLTTDSTQGKVAGPDLESTNSSSLNPPKAISLDITKLVKEKGISPADILQDFNTMFNFSETHSVTSSPETKEKTTVSLRPYIKGAERYRPYRPPGHINGNRNIHRGIISNRLSSTSRPTLRPPYSPKPPSINYGETDEKSEFQIIANGKETTVIEESTSSNNSESQKNNLKKKNKFRDFLNYSVVKTSPENLEVSTRSAIMAAGILGGVALSVFIAIFIVVKYRNHVHRNRRRFPLGLPSDSSSSSLPPLYPNRTTFPKECYQTSGFWTTLKKRFDPYSTSSSPTSM